MTVAPGLTILFNFFKAFTVLRLIPKVPCTRSHQDSMWVLMTSDPRSFGEFIWGPFSPALFSLPAASTSTAEVEWEPPVQ